MPLIGLGPHIPPEEQDLNKLYVLKTKTQQIRKYFAPFTLINLLNFSSIKSETRNTLTHSSMANYISVQRKMRVVLKFEEKTNENSYSNVNEDIEMVENFFL